MDILNAKFVKEMCDTTANMYRLGWDERNGGNISYLLDEEEVAKYLDLSKISRTIDMGFKADPLIGKIFIVTGTGKYFKNVEKEPENNLGIIRIGKDGHTAELLWGFEDGSKFTSELPAHLMSHMARLSVDPENRVIIHSHPTNTLAMNYIHELDEKKFTHTLWEMCTECIVVFPDGVGVLPWMLCGTNEIGEATAKKMKEFRLVVWALHGIYGAGKSLDETFGLIETVEKAAQIYMLTSATGKERINTIKDEDMVKLAEYFGVDYRRDFLDLPEKSIKRIS
ncbi:rhamnulose-1-phosphate aldolase [Lachnospira pectinoschiza]|uniref:Rhamnulose-1-phosphate aldolase n=1 Tax=Lachnospira pectinoschiza TaxID=28052 RepID=A0A1G9VV99_9FIRM|nr:rhamnulose-1-phosphate aldolase [Lachnospira pectinoschiza]SDM76184.1 L-rhamnulose 1-phosphate aldolase [Lachnospira pectinoschiza]